MKGHIRQRTKDTWSIVIDGPRRADGKRRQKWHKVKGTKKDAERELAKLLHQRHTGEYVEPSKQTLAEYLAHWLEAYARPNVTGKTFERYSDTVRMHLVPALGHHLLAKLTPMHIQEYYSKALQSGRRDGKGGLCALTVMQHHRLLRQALQQAIKWQTLVRNPADAAEPPRPQRKEMLALNEQEADRLMEAAASTPLRVPVMLAITTGMRRGEILALRWRDLDLGAATLSVQQSLETTSASGLVFKQPKSGKGRLISLLPMTVDTLLEHRQAQMKERQFLGKDYQEHGLVCARLDGRPIHPDTLSVNFSALVAKMNLPRVSLHDLRHTHATLLLRAGVHPKIVSARLGHATVSITLDLYSHMLPGMQEEAAGKLESLLQAAKSKAET